MTATAILSVISRAEAKAQGLKQYFTGVPCKNGHVDMRNVSSWDCCQCNRDRVLARYYKNHESFLKKQAQIRSRPEHAKANKEYMAQYSKLPHAIEARRAWHRDKLKSDAVWAIGKRARNLVRDCLQRFGHNKTSKTVEILGCSIPDFKVHIERQFSDGMSWENMGDWEIDHILPISSAVSQEDAISLNHFTNLRPLWRKENRAKSDRVMHLI